MSWVACSSDEEAAHGEEDHGLRDIEPSFVVTDKASVSRQPSDAALDHPTPGDHPEAWVGIGAAHDLDHEVEESRLVEKTTTIIGSVGKEVLDPRPALADGVQDWLGTGAIGNVRCRQVHGEQTPVGVHRDMAFAPDDLLPGIVTTRFGHRGLDRLAVDNTRRGAGLSSGALTINHQRYVMDSPEQEKAHKTHGGKNEVKKLTDAYVAVWAQAQGQPPGFPPGSREEAFSASIVAPEALRLAVARS